MIIFISLAGLAFIGIIAAILVMIHEGDVSSSETDTAEVSGQFSEQYGEQWMKNYEMEDPKPIPEEAVIQSQPKGLFAKLKKAFYPENQEETVRADDVPQATQFSVLHDQIVDKVERRGVKSSLTHLETKTEEAQSPHIPDKQEPTTKEQTAEQQKIVQPPIQSADRPLNHSHNERSEHLSHLLKETTAELEKTKSELNLEKSHRENFDQVKSLLDSEIQSLKTKNKTATEELKSWEKKYQNLEEEFRLCKKKVNELEYCLTAKGLSIKPIEFHENKQPESPIKSNTAENMTQNDVEKNTPITNQNKTPLADAKEPTTPKKEPLEEPNKKNETTKNSDKDDQAVDENTQKDNP